MVKLKRIYESTLFLEAKKDLDDLKEYLGQDLFDAYMEIRDRIPKDQNDFKDFSKLKKKDIKDIQDFIDSFQSKSDKKKQDKSEGAEKIYDGEDWVVYKITTYPAAQLYGKNTKWCITGRYPGHEGKGEEYFNSYIDDNDLDGGYYFFIDKHNPSRKYCALQYRTGGIHSIWNAEDSVLTDVDYNDVPMDLLNIVDDLPGKLGDAISYYIEYKLSGSNHSIYLSLLNELRKNKDSWDQHKIDTCIERLKDFYSEDDWSDLFIFLNEDRFADGFAELSKEILPSIHFLDGELVKPDCLEALLDSFINYGSLRNKERYGRKLFLELVRTYGDSSNREDYPVIDNPKKILSVLGECGKDVFDVVSFEDVVNNLGDAVIYSKDFLPICFKHGLDDSSFIDSLKYIEDNKRTIQLVKSSVENKLLDLNKLYEGSTYFMRILNKLSTSVEDVKWMLSHGADPSVKDSDGDTAIEYTKDSKIKNLLSKE